MSFSSEGFPMPSLRELDLPHSAVACGGHGHFERVRVFALLVSLLLWWSPMLLLAQSSGAAKSSNGEPEGVTSNGYVIHSSVEVGYRATDITGSGDMYSTLVDLPQGPRLLEQTLSMRSVNHQGLLFDNLYVSSFGWGGEPDNALRIRADKNKWYNLAGSFRRDHNFSDFNLLANPLNPSTSSPTIQAENSPHLFDTGRRMSDVDLTLLPQSRLSFRLGFSHNNMTGPSYTSIHEGTDGLLLQPWNTTLNSYRFGADWRILPRTVLSYDQSFDYYKGDTSTQLAPFAPALLPSPGVGSVELGLSIDTVNNVPCAVKPPATSLIDPTGTLTNTSCSAFFNYALNRRVRTSTPTERLSLRSNYFQRVDIIGSFSYSAADMTTPLNESFDGLITRTKNRAFTDTGTAAANRISDTLDLETTIHFTKHLRLVEKFYFWAYRIPENANFNEIDNICTGTCNLLTPLSATAPATTNTLTASSFNQTWKRNQTDLAWDISKKAGARIGFRYGNRVFNHFNDYLPGDEDHIVVGEYTALLGLWARPTHNLRLSFDMEHVNYDNVIVRMAPRKESRFRAQTTYTPKPWAVLGGSFHILRDANPDAATHYIGHNQNFGLTASLTPRERFGLDLAYNYNNVTQNALICFNDTPPLGVVLPFVTGATPCVVDPTANPLLANSYFTNHTHYGMGAVRFVPAKRWTLNLGYSVTSVDGSIPQFNILQPLGALQYKYSQPVAGVSVDLGHRLAFNMGWNYYQYNEGSFIGPTAPRYFHANAVTESLRYAF
jgi:hypothetical protein